MLEKPSFLYRSGYNEENIDVIDSHGEKGDDEDCLSLPYRHASFKGIGPFFFLVGICTLSCVCFQLDRTHRGRCPVPSLSAESIAAIQATVV